MIAAREILEAVRANGITHVVGLPDNTSAALWSLLESKRTPVLVRVTREGEAFAIAAGLWMGGARPVVLVQNTGLMESGDSLRGTAVRMRVPLLCLVTYRGFVSLPAVDAGITTTDNIGLLDRPEVDSAAVLTEPTLGAWGIPYRLLGDDPGTCVAAAAADAERRRGPVAVLLPVPLG